MIKDSLAKITTFAGGECEVTVCCPRAGAIVYSYFIIIADVNGCPLFVGHYLTGTGVFYNCLTGRIS